MPITYGRTLAKTWGAQRMIGTVLMKAYTPHTEKSEVFLSYQHSDRDTALGLAEYLDRHGRYVFIDVHDDTLLPGDSDLDDALMEAIRNADTMVIVVSDETQGLMVGAMGDWRVDAFPETQGHVQAAGKPVTSGLPPEVATATEFRDCQSVGAR